MPLEGVTEDWVDEYVKKELERMVQFYVESFARFMTSYVRGAAARFRQIYTISPVVTTTTELGRNYMRMVIEMSIPEDQVARIEQIIRNEIAEKSTATKIRLKTLYKLIHNKLESETGELGALLSDMRSSPPKSDGKAGGGRAEVRRQEGGPAAEGIDEGAV